MKLICRGRVNEGHFIKALSRLSAIELPKELELYIIDSPKYCREVVAPLPASQKAIFRRFCNREHASFSYAWGGREVVVIQISPQNSFVKKSVEAAAGLLAHELSHTLLRRKGLDRHLVDCYADSYYSNFKLLKKLKLPRERLEDLFAAVGAEALMALKDLYTNQEVLSLGLGDCLLDYYYERVGSLGYCPVPTSKSPRKAFVSDAGFASLVDSLRFQLTLLPIYAPFYGYRSRKAKTLIARIRRCYEKGNDEITREFKGVRRLALTEFSPSCAFHKKYFDLVFMKAYKLLI